MPPTDLLVIVEDALIQILNGDEKVAPHNDIELRQVLGGTILCDTPPFCEEQFVLFIPINTPLIKQLVKLLTLGWVSQVDEAQPIPLKPERRRESFAAKAIPPNKGQFVREKG